MKKLPGWLRNKYAVTAIAFIAWLLFFDRNDIFSQWTYREQLKKLEAEKAYYLSEISRNREDMKELMSDPEHLEKYARERYLMKRDDEEIFLIVHDSLKNDN